MRPDHRSILTRPGPDPDAVVRYGAAADQLVELFAPPGPPTPVPVVVLLHGGFWQQEYDRTHVRPLAGALRELGHVVAVPEYGRLGGRGGWPTTFDDVAAVRTSLPRVLSEVLPGRADPERLVAVGHSAGGHLALWWGLTTVHPPSLVVALAPVADLARGHGEHLGDGAVAQLMGGPPDEQPDRYARADPATMLPARFPVTVVHGSDDAQVPVQHSRALAGVELMELPGVEHFALIDPLSPAWPAVAAAITGATNPV